MEIQCKSVDQMPLLRLYLPIQEVLIEGCLCSNTSYTLHTALKCNTCGDCPPLAPIQGSHQISSVSAPRNLVWAWSLYFRPHPTVPEMACTLVLPFLCPIYKEESTPHKWWDCSPREIQLLKRRTWQRKNVTGVVAGVISQDGDCFCQLSTGYSCPALASIKSSQLHIWQLGTLKWTVTAHQQNDH